MDHTIDGIASGAWQLDPDTRTSLRLQQTRQALERGDYVLAMVEAEELLDEEPHHAEALLLLAEAQLAMGDAEGAEDAFSQHLGLVQTASPSALAGLAIARFEIGRFQGAVEAARDTLRAAADNAEAHYYMALALERLGRTREATGAFAAAFQLAPNDYPYPMELDGQQILSALGQAASRLPEHLEEFWTGVPVHIEEEPTVDELGRGPRIPPTVAGMFVGSPSPEDPERPPSAIRLFRRNLARAGSWDVLVEQLEALLEHEGLAWLGIAPDPWDELG